MSLSLSDLLTPQTQAQVLSTLYTLAGALGLNTTAWQKLSPTRTIFAIIAQIYAGFTSSLVQIAQSGFLDLAVGGWLDLVAQYVFGVTRNPALFAEGPVTIVNSAGGLYTFGVGDLTVLNSTTGQTYTNTATVTINPLSTVTGIDVIATQAGAIGTATPGQINAFSVGSFPGLAVTNPASIVGADAELDADLRTRCRAKLGSLSPAGAEGAFPFVATTQSLNGGVNCTRAVVLPPPGNGTITVVVAGPSGPISGTTGNPATDLGKLFLALNKLAVPAGYTLILASATSAVITPNATLYVSLASGLTSGAAQSEALAALTAYVPTIPIGGISLGAGGAVLYRILEDVMRDADTGIVQAQLVVEADIPLTPSQVAVLGAPVLSVVFV